MTSDELEAWIKRVFRVGKLDGLGWPQAMIETANVLAVHRQTAYRKVAGTSPITKAEAALLAQYEKEQPAVGDRTEKVSNILRWKVKAELRRKARRKAKKNDPL